jgi:hypothetical protein
MRIIGFVLLMSCLALLGSCSNRCSTISKNQSFYKDSILVYNKIISDEFKSLRIQNKNKATYILDNDLIQLNLKNQKKTKLIDGNLLESIDFIDVLKKYSKNGNYSTPEFHNQENGNSSQISALFEVKKLSNYWIDCDTIYLFVKASTPTMDRGKIVASTTKFLVTVIDSKIISIKPLICDIAAFSLEDDAVYKENGVFYFSTLPIVFKDSISSFSTNLPSLLVSYQINTGAFKKVNLLMSASDLKTYARYIEKHDLDYCSFINIAHCFRFNNKLCFTDTKNLFYASNLDISLFKNIQLNPHEDVITAIPSNTINDGEMFLFYKGNRNEIDGKITMSINALNTCTGAVLESKTIQYHNKCSNVFYFINQNDRLYLVEWRYK